MQQQNAFVSFLEAAKEEETPCDLRSERQAIRQEQAFKHCGFDISQQGPMILCGFRRRFAVERKS